MILLMDEIPNNHLVCKKTLYIMGFQLPFPQLVSLPDFWTINSITDNKDGLEWKSLLKMDDLGGKTTI